MTLSSDPIASTRQQRKLDSIRHLHEQGLDVEQIAQRLGYSETRYLTDWFTRYSLTPPWEEPVELRKGDLIPAWTLRAACADAPEEHRRLLIAEQLTRDDIHTATGYCRRCPVRAECRALVKPETSYFSGICGGEAWCEGRRVDPENGSNGGVARVPMWRASRRAQALVADGWNGRDIASYIGLGDDDISRIINAKSKTVPEVRLELIDRAYREMPPGSNPYALRRAQRNGWPNRAAWGDRIDDEHYHPHKQREAA